MDYSGTVHGNRIDLDETVPLRDGTRVRVEVREENGVRRGSPEAVLKLVGTLTPQEAEDIRAAAQSIRKIDPELWADRS
jgi:hypothetical protein